MRRKYGWIWICLALLLLAGCKKETEVTTDPLEEVPTVEEVQEPEESVTPEEPEVTEPEEPEVIEPVEENHDNDVRSRLTGMWIPKEYEYSRPYAIMLNNIEYAYPQAGTEEAGILYEILTEGGITRLMGLYDYVTTDRIGSVRSARHYFVTLAEGYDAIFVHFGQTKYAEKEFEKLGTDHLNGVKGEGTVVFYRDEAVKEPHNAFASAEGIQAGLKYKKYTGELAADKKDNFKFSTEVEVVLDKAGSMNAEKVTLPFSSVARPYFTYDNEKKVYYRHEYGSQHVDAVTQNPLGFTTLLVQLVNEYNIDKNGYQTMDLEYSNGRGYYITGGKSIPVYWSMANASDSVHYYYDEARTQEIELNPGKIYIAVFPSYCEKSMDIR